MKSAKLLMIGLLSLAVLPAMADDKMDGKKKEYYQRHMRMQQMLKETMGIIANLNHTPSAEDKKKLEAMMKELDGMTMDKEMHHGDGHMHGDKK
ncbi:MAG: hypothetical protein AABY83_01580 [Pseudomonadota bacterium]